MLSCFGLASEGANRLLPSASLKKPVKLPVAECHSGSMTEKAGEDTITVWLGYVDECLAEKIDFSEGILPSIGLECARLVALRRHPCLNGDQGRTQQAIQQGAQPAARP